MHYISQIDLTDIDLTDIDLNMDSYTPKLHNQFTASLLIGLLVQQSNGWVIKLNLLIGNVFNITKRWPQMDSIQCKSNPKHIFSIE